MCLATSGPGGIHLLNGLYDAKLDHMPVLAITGMQETSVLGTGYQQEVALDKLYADVAEYDQMIYNPVQLPALVDIAIRTAYARRGVAHLTVPNDIQVADADADPWQHVAPAAPPKTAAIYLPPARPARTTQDLQRLADFLNDGDKIAILAGAGALHAREELLALAETLAAPDRQDAAGQGHRARRLAVHHRRDRPARHQAVRRPDGRDRHLVHGRYQLPVHQAPAAAGPGCAQIEADPARAGARIADRGAGGRRRP